MVSATIQIGIQQGQLSSPNRFAKIKSDRMLEEVVRVRFAGDFPPRITIASQMTAYCGAIWI
jgi:pyruvate/oxaloacetate carboxyltransferase